MTIQDTPEQRRADEFSGFAMFTATRDEIVALRDSATPSEDPDVVGLHEMAEAALSGSGVSWRNCERQIFEARRVASDLPAHSAARAAKCQALMARTGLTQAEFRASLSGEDADAIQFGGVQSILDFWTRGHDGHVDYYP